MQNVTILVVSPRPQMRDARGETLLRSLREDAQLAVEQVRTAALYTIRSPRIAEELEPARGCSSPTPWSRNRTGTGGPRCRASGSCRSPCCPA